MKPNIVPEKREHEDWCVGKEDHPCDCGISVRNHAIDEMAENIAKMEKGGWVWGKRLDEDDVYLRIVSSCPNMTSSRTRKIAHAICQTFVLKEKSNGKD